MKYILVILFFISSQSVFAQLKLPVIKATSKSVSINDDGFLDKNAWSLSPGARPDVYTADRSRKDKWVTFYTDIDSIRIKVKPGAKYNFIILLNGKDSCYTQIASAVPAETLTKNNTITHDTIPFTLTAYNAIAVKTIINNTDTLNLHFDASSFDFHLTKDAILKRTGLLSNQPDALTGKTTPNYNKLNKVFRLQMGSMVWTAPEIIPTGLTAHDMDGRFGWNLFEGKTVEINYDSNLLIIHSQLPKNLAGYAKSKIEFTRSFPHIKGTFEYGGKKHTGNFTMDIGSEQAVILDSAWLSKQNFPKDLKLISSAEIRDPRGVKYETQTVLAPIFKLNNLPLVNVPAVLLSGKNPMGFEINYLGNDVLKRFNIILDFKNDYIYLKPNKLNHTKYKANS